jgi:hypothetical protein
MTEVGTGLLFHTVAIQPNTLTLIQFAYDRQWTTNSRTFLGVSEMGSIFFPTRSCNPLDHQEHWNRHANMHC